MGDFYGFIYHDSRFFPVSGIRNGFYLVSKLVSEKENIMGNTRKKNGEGSVFQLSENKWVAKISYGTIGL